jgi:hypothetical protein
LPPTQPPGLPEPVPVVQVRDTLPFATREIVNVSPVAFEVELTDYAVADPVAADSVADVVSASVLSVDWRFETLVLT